MGKARNFKGISKLIEDRQSEQLSSENAEENHKSQSSFKDGLDEEVLETFREKDLSINQIKEIPNALSRKVNLLNTQKYSSYSSRAFQQNFNQNKIFPDEARKSPNFSLTRDHARH